MNANPTQGTFQSTSQRVAATYRRMLSEFYPVLPAGLDLTRQAEMQAAQADLHAFFQALYDALFDHPDQFGLPPVPDVYLLVDHSKEGPDKTEVKQTLDRQRKLVEDGLNFLSVFARAARLEGPVMVLPASSAAADFSKKKSGRAWLQGMQIAGFVLTQSEGTLSAANPRFPLMMPALKDLAESCATFKDEHVGMVFFTRCDFRALRHESRTTALDLYRAFDPTSYDWAAGLHAFFTSRGYQEQVEINRLFGWTVKYQGKKSVKATPLFQVGFDDRFLQPMRAQIKCASAQRVIPLLPGQSSALQDDFSRRAVPCSGCTWCTNNKTLGPTEFEDHGKTRKVCWYVNADLDQYTEETADLVKEYAQMHEKLG
jgi:hypothetical protein